MNHKLSLPSIDKNPALTERAAIKHELEAENNNNY